MFCPVETKVRQRLGLPSPDRSGIELAQATSHLASGASTRAVNLPVSVTEGCVSRNAGQSILHALHESRLGAKQVRPHAIVCVLIQGPHFFTHSTSFNCLQDDYHPPPAISSSV